MNWPFNTFVLPAPWIGQEILNGQVPQVILVYESYHRTWFVCYCTSCSQSGMDSSPSTMPALPSHWASFWRSHSCLVWFCHGYWMGYITLYPYWCYRWRQMILVPVGDTGERKVDKTRSGIWTMKWWLNSEVIAVLSFMPHQRCR